MKSFFLSLFCPLLLCGANLDSFFYALGKVESSSNLKAINIKENALGMYQIRLAYFKDSKVPGNHRGVFDPIFARKVCEAYFIRYEREAFNKRDFEILARLHNSGPFWREKKQSTNNYWNKIKKNLK